VLLEKRVKCSNTIVTETDRRVALVLHAVGYQHCESLCENGVWDNTEGTTVPAF
jgi:hypothetical protein